MDQNRNKTKERQDTGEPIIHPIPPLYDQDSRILILGSFPSVKSREQQFFYGHEQNRFWKVIAAITGNHVPRTISEKKALLLRSGIAVWDVIASCTITGSADSSIKNVIPNDLSRILQETKIHKIYTNGTKADQLYRKHLYPQTGIEAIKLPSTSPANATYSLEQLIAKWYVIRKELTTI